jgi:hypothetical protein
MRDTEKGSLNSRSEFLEVAPLSLSCHPTSVWYTVGYEQKFMKESMSSAKSPEGQILEEF